MTNHKSIILRTIEMHRNIPLSALVLLLTAVNLRAEEPADPSAWKPEDIVNQEAAHSFMISPDEKWVVWVKSMPNPEENKLIGKIILSSLEGKKEVQLTQGKSEESSPQFSPDGQRISFLSNREKGNQIWLIDFPGGEPRQLTKLENGVEGFAWVDTNTIFFTAPEDNTYRENRLKEEKDDVIIVADQEHYGPVRLFKIDVNTGKAERLTNNPFVITGFAVSPDGKWVVTNENQSVDWEYEHKIPPKQYLYNLERKTREELFADVPHRYPFDFKWSRDGRGFYCVRDVAADPADTYVSINTLCYCDLESRKLTDVNLEWERGLFDSGRFITEEGILVTLANGTMNRLAHYRKFPGQMEWGRTWLDDRNISHIGMLAYAKSGNSLIFSHSTASMLPRYMSGRLVGDAIVIQNEIAEINKPFKAKTLARTEVIAWRGALGEIVDGILYYPHNYVEGSKYPLIPVIHGGPSSYDMDRFDESWADYPNLLAGKGAFVLKVNYHGSGNYGLAWVESIKGRYYELEVPDILSGIDYLIGRGMVDPGRVGIMGWSNGSILSIASCLARPGFFKVLCAGAGDVNWTSDYGNCAFGAAFDNAYFGGPPWENPEYYVEKSPLFRMAENTTPTLIMFGTKDTAVPTQQGWEHFRAMQQIGKAPVRFLLFPDQPHSLGKLSHRLRKMKEEIAWFDTYLFDRAEKENEAFKKDSPLALALEREKAARHNGLYGRFVDGILIPETIKQDGLMVGKFEVTRAQFREFRNDLPLETGKENYPVSGIEFEEALKYCDWLRQKTGMNFRLPTGDEMKRLDERAVAERENTLDFWAGYRTTPGDAELLLKKISRLSSVSPLLMEVGSMKPAGEQGLYDMKGNVSEWCMDAGGEGCVMGLSAVSSADGKAVFHIPPKEYIGLRVCYGMER